MIITLMLVTGLVRQQPDSTALRTAVREALGQVYERAGGHGEHIVFLRHSVERALGLGDTPALSELASAFGGRGTEDRAARCGPSRCVAIGLRAVKRSGDSLRVVVVVDKPPPPMTTDTTYSEEGYTVLFVWNGQRYVYLRMAFSSVT